jgi:hypothetical protein
MQLFDRNLPASFVSQAKLSTLIARIDRYNVCHRKRTIAVSSCQNPRTLNTGDIDSPIFRGSILEIDCDDNVLETIIMCSQVERATHGQYDNQAR